MTIMLSCFTFGNEKSEKKGFKKMRKIVGFFFFFEDLSFQGKFEKLLDFNTQNHYIKLDSSFHF